MQYETYAPPTNWALPAGDSFYKTFKERGELYSMTLPDWEIASKYLTKKRKMFDIGGHIGTTALRYANNFEHVYTFEPLYYDLLALNLKHVRNYTLIPKAVSDEETDMTMIKRRGNSGLSLIVTGMTQHYKMRGGYDPKEMPIKTMRIDDGEYDEIDFIKIDTEGFVIKPLRGMIETLERNDFPLLQIEFNNLNQEPETCLKLLKDLGYEKVDEFHVDQFFMRA